MEMLTGRLAAVFKCFQDVHSTLLDAAVPIRWTVSLDTDCGKKEKIKFHIQIYTINPHKRGKGKQKHLEMPVTRV